MAVVLGRPEEAERHFETGLEMNARINARPWTAHTQHDFASMLLSYDASGPRERAYALLNEALETTRVLDMVRLEAKIKELLDDAPVPTAVQTASLRRSEFRREGEYWSVAFGDEAFRLRDAKGLRHLARLLAAPGREFHALDLVRMEEGHAERTGVSESAIVAQETGDAGEVLDSEAKAAYKQRLRDLDEELQEAEDWNDPARAARAREEIDFLTKELAGAVGLAGRDRRAASSAERARQSVTRAMKAAMTRIAENGPSLGNHLEATVKTGTFCSYSPDPRVPVIWQV